MSGCRRFTNLGLLAAIPLIAIGIAAPQTQSKHEQRTLEVNGHTGNATVCEIYGKSYVDLESLAPPLVMKLITSSIVTSGIN